MAENKITSATRTPPAPPSQPSFAQQGQADGRLQGAKPARGGGASAHQPTVRDINRLSGLASGLNTDKTIEALIAVERKRLEPLQEEKAQRSVELESVNVIKGEIERMHDAAKTLAGRAIWEGKLVESSNEKAVKATASAGAKPGKYTLIVDKLALNHQIASQGYESQDAQVGLGRFKITVGEGAPVTITVDRTNNTLAGLKDAINTATQDVQASIIKTGNREKPYQLVLTSQKTGTVGRLKPEVDLKGGMPPVFINSVDEPSPWKGVGEAEKAAAVPGAAKGASDAIARIVGDYMGDADHTFTFTAVQNGQIGGDRQLQMRWKDDSGRSGLLQLDKLHYAPGTPVELADGLSVVFSQGNVVVGDSFSFQARAERSELSWWLSPEDRKASYAQPTAWERQATFGAPKVEGPYTGREGLDFTLTVKGSGQVGAAPELNVLWKSSAGESGLLNIGDGYQAGSQLALTDGIMLTLNAGVLTAGQQATFRVTPQERSGKWWLSDAQRIIPSQVLDVSNWTVPEEIRRKKGGAQAGRMPELPPEAGPRTSSSKVVVAGQYTGEESKVYTFTAKADGVIGTTKNLKVHWEDDNGGSGDLNLGEGYVEGTPAPFDAGLTAAFGGGRLFKDDSFTVRTRTSTVQPAQDAVIRLGATELGGGLEVTNSTNELDNVIEGVKLSLAATDPKPITVTIKGDTAKAGDAIIAFMNEVNQFEALIVELTKYDKDNDYVGPLQANEEVSDMRNRVNRLIMDPVAGLPKTANMVFGLGVKINDKGVFIVDEDALRQKVESDFASVADLFRDKGESNNSGVVFVGMSDATRISPQGYPVKIRKVATEAVYVSPELQEPVVIDNANNRIAIDVDGKRSDEIVLEPKRYSLQDYVRTLQNKITNDKQVGDRGVRVSLEGRRVRVQSGRFGKGSGVSFVASGDRTQAGVGLLNGQVIPGQDVEGTIQGQEADGIGQLLKAKDGAPNVGGLRLLVKLNPAQLKPDGPEATIKITRGVASRVSQYLGEELDPFKGEVKRMADGLRTQVSNLNTQLDRMDERIEAKRRSLQEKFSRLETQMAKLKSQQTYMNGQLAQLGTGGGGKNGMVSQLLG